MLTIDIWVDEVVIGMLTDIMLVMLNGVEIIVLFAAVIVFEFTLSALYAVDAMTGVLIGALADAIIGVVLGMGSAAANMNVLTAVMTASDFAMPVPSEESIPFC